MARFQKKCLLSGLLLILLWITTTLVSIHRPRPTRMSRLDNTTENLGNKNVTFRSNGKINGSNTTQSKVKIDDLAMGGKNKETSNVSINVKSDVKEERDSSTGDRKIWRQNVTSLPLKPNHVSNKTLLVTRKMPLPYSNFSYPLEVDFQGMYKEFSHSGRISRQLTQINPHPFEYIHLSSRCDTDSNKNVSLLILVKSSVNNFYLRKSIRATWGNVSEENVKVVYLLAYNKSLQAAVDEEAKKNGDIIQETFIDAYLNNTYKIIMGFNWAVKHCQQAKYQLFVDDDHFLILPNIIKYINDLKPSISDTLFAGWRIANVGPYRDKSIKWYVSFDLYPFDKWPPYLAGGAFILSREVLKKFQFAFPFVKYIGIDDCYLGIVAKKFGIDPQHVPSLKKPTPVLYKDVSHFAYHDFKSFGEFKKAMNFYQNKTVKHHVINVKN